MMNKLRSTIKKIPILGDIAMFFYRKINAVPKFTTSGEYWESRYNLGGNSGAGSYNILAEHKADVINNFVNEKNVESVIEFGCGDGNQLKYFNFKSYIGFDISQTIINACKEIFKSDSTKQFKTLNEYNNEKADLVLSLDVIYHLIEDAAFFDYMKKLFNSSNKYVLVYSSNDDNHENNNKDPHVKHRTFTRWVEQNAPNFKLIAHIPNKYPYNENDPNSSIADFYFFQIKN